MARKTKKQVQQRKDLVHYASSLFAIALSLVGLFQFGIVGLFLSNVMRVIMGNLPQIYFALIAIVFLLNLLKRKPFKLRAKHYLAIFLLFVSFSLIESLIYKTTLIGWDYVGDYFSRIGIIFSTPEANAYSGIIGSLFYGLFSVLLGREGTVLFVVVFLLIVLAIFMSPKKVIDSAADTGVKTKGFFGKFKREKKIKEIQVKEPKTIDALIESNYEKEHDTKASFMTVNDVEPSSDKKPVQVQAEVQDSPKTNVNDASTDLSQYHLPPMNLLDSVKKNQRSGSNDSAAKVKSELLIKVLKQFGIEASIIKIHIGPAVTKFELKPDSSVKISKISSIQDNLMMELAVKTLRIEAPIPGKSAVGIEIPNEEMIPVRMRDIIDRSPEFMSSDNINVVLGKNLMGAPITIALNKMPHLLIAGATGSGKSVCMNAIITSILLSKRPEELQLLLIDPKKVEFAQYDKIPHLMGPLISDPLKAAAALKVIVDQMENRYELFAKTGVRNITSYNEKIKEFPEENNVKMPWIVVIIDELADLMSVAGKEVETSIQRITQLARAAGIHLIVATQRPSVDVVTGVIKANIPSRIAFAVSSSIDSRTIIDGSGAEKLLGFGDMLYVPMGEPHPIRIQGAFVSDDEVNKIAQNVSSQASPRFLDEFINLDGVSGNQGTVSAIDDPLYIEAKKIVIQEQKASTSWLQRQFRIGYNRAASIMDALEQNGVIGPANGSKARLINVQVELDPEEEA